MNPTRILASLWVLGACTPPGASPTTPPPPSDTEDPEVPTDSGDTDDTGSNTWEPPPCPADQLAPTLLDDVAYATWHGDPHSTSKLGHSVAFAGSWGPAGEETVLLGAPLWGNTLRDESQVGGTVFAAPAAQGASAVAGAATWSVAHTPGEEFVGDWVLPLGDVDGDGSVDVAVAKRRDYVDQGAGDGLPSGRGEVRLFYGPLAGADTTSEAAGRVAPERNPPPGEPSWVIQTVSVPTLGPAPAQLWVLVSDTSSSSPHPYPLIEIWVFELPVYGAVSRDDAHAILLPSADDEYFTTALVAAGGDVSGDGADDMVLWSTTRESDGSITGRHLYAIPAHIPAGVHLVQDVASVHHQSADPYGTRLHTIGDVNGDGIADIGLDTSAHPGADMSFDVYFGPLTPDTDFTQPGATFPGVPGVWFVEVTAAGDFDGDGFTDLLVSAPGACSRVYLFRGPIAGVLDPADAWVLGGAHEVYSGWYDWQFWGRSLVGGYDFDGDGLADFLLGVSKDSEAGPGAGKAYLIRGRPLD